MSRTRSDQTNINQKQDVYVVDDPTQPQPQPQPTEQQHVMHTPPLPPHLQDANTNIIDAQPAPPASIPKAQQKSNKKSMLESLLFLGRATKELEIGNLKFEISTLTQKENAALMKELYKAGDGADLFTIRASTLAYAIRTINDSEFNDIPLDDPEEENSFETLFDKKFAILESMQKSIVEKIYDKYLDLINSTNNIVEENGDDLKNL